MFTSLAVTLRAGSSGRLVLDGKIEICHGRFLFYFFFLLNSQVSPLVQIPLCGFTFGWICKDVRAPVWLGLAGDCFSPIPSLVCAAYGHCDGG